MCVRTKMFLLIPTELPLHMIINYRWRRKLATNLYKKSDKQRANFEVSEFPNTKAHIIIWESTNRAFDVDIAFIVEQRMG